MPPTAPPPGPSRHVSPSGLPAAPDDTAVLVPVKSFRRAKARLTGALDPAARHLLARWMAERVVAAAGPLPVFVACDDDEVADWADATGAEVLWSPGMGLNGAVDSGVTTISGKGFTHVVISHGDLPLARSLAPIVDLVRRGHVVLVPDRRADGTNVLGRPCRVEIPASYGAGSFRQHLTWALAGGCSVTVRHDAELSLDLDTVADLHHPLVWPVVGPLVEGASMIPSERATERSDGQPEGRR